ncbi:MAG: phosphotransferase family protein [Anaerolineae bacterium]
MSEADAPAPEVLRWIADALGPGARVVSTAHIAGATSSTLYRVQARTPRGAQQLVLRLFTLRAWVAEEPDLAPHEAASLEKVAAAGLPAPRLVAYDADGACCGVPAVLMTELPGTVLLRPPDLDDWLQQLADAVAAIHQIIPDDFPWRYASYYDPHTLTPPAWSNEQALWERALARLREPPPDEPPRFIHRDYHPCNVLWHKGHVSGMVDWPNACVGPVSEDLAHCRANLNGLYGLEAADAFLRHYRAISGAPDLDPYWDLAALGDGLPGPPDVYPPWRTFGMTELTDRLMLERDEAMLRQAVARL